MMSGLILVVATGIALSGSSTAAQANSSNPKAIFTFEAPIRKWQRTVVDDRVMYCETDRCTGEIEPIPSAQMRACRTLRRRFGNVVTVRIGSVDWDRTKLDTCNASRKSG
jgi:hypothetical protein